MPRFNTKGYNGMCKELKEQEEYANAQIDAFHEWRNGLSEDDMFMLWVEHHAEEFRNSYNRVKTGGGGEDGRSFRSVNVKGPSL